VNIYQQYIINKSSPQGTQRTQDVCTIFFLLQTSILGVYQQQLNRVQLYKSTNSICKTQLTSSTPTEMRQQSSTDINLSQVRDLSVVQPACVCTLAHYSLRMYMVSLYYNLCMPSELLRVFSSKSTQILCNLQSYSLLSFTVQTDPQPVTTHPSSPITYSCFSTIQYECYSIMYKKPVYYSNHISTES
jgi:hypothetical protein